MYVACTRKCSAQRKEQHIPSTLSLAPHTLTCNMEWESSIILLCVRSRRMLLPSPFIPFWTHIRSSAQGNRCLVLCAWWITWQLARLVYEDSMSVECCFFFVTRKTNISSEPSLSFYWFHFYYSSRTRNMSCWRGISAAAAAVATLQTVSSARLYINKGDHEQGPSGQKWPRFHDPSVFTASEPRRNRVPKRQQHTWNT